MAARHFWRIPAPPLVSEPQLTLRPDRRTGFTVTAKRSGENPRALGGDPRATQKSSRALRCTGVLSEAPEEENTRD